MTHAVAPAPISALKQSDTPHAFLHEPLEALKVSVSACLNPDDVGPTPTKSFAEGLPGVNRDALPSRPITRTEIFDLAAGSALDTPTLCVAIMAWGGMHRSNRDALFKRSPTDWFAICEDIRQGRLGRLQAYDAFRSLREAKKLKGMGPAFFTKLIYFLSPRAGKAIERGYIMDQWAGCSMNVLTGVDVVLMNSTMTWKNGRNGVIKSTDFMVSDVNSGANYQAFCGYVDALSEHFGITAEEIDRALMSDGGRSPLSWRQYVVEHRN